ncbi:MFS transporter [Mesobacillus harenae]|uniref:MFS transporter n=1 Tax=Mesobacillus harenae TaxID=2213203 RepID=UPI00157FF310|nr:MFS transporter [Mesobacillus harenae]
MLEQKVDGGYIPTTALELTQPGKKEMWAYGVGSFGIFAITTLIGAFLTYYYTDIAGISAGVVGTLMLVARLFDGVTDIGMGTIVDRTRSKHGKARAWLLWMTVPLAVTMVLLFAVPDIGMTGKIIYAYSTYILFILLYTAVSIPYKTLLGLMTQHQHSRSMSNIYAAIFIMVGNLLVMTLTQPLTAAMGWTPLAVLYGFVTITALAVTFFFVKERVKVTASMQENIPFKASYRALLKNKYWFIVTGFSVTFYATIGLTQGSALYYAQYVFGNVNYYPLIGMAISLPMLVGLFFLGPVVKKFGKRNVVMWGACLFIIGQIVRMVEPTSLVLFLIGCTLGGLGAMPALALIFAMINDTVEYGEWKTGLRTEGLVNSGASFGIKAGSGIGIGLIGWMLAYGGYVGGGGEQTALSIKMIMILNLHIPLGLAVIQVILMFLFKIDKEYPTILADLQNPNFRKK